MVFYFSQQHFKPTDVPNITFTQTTSTITIHTTVNGHPADLWWKVWIEPKVAPQPFYLDTIAAAGANSKLGNWTNSSESWAELGSYAEARCENVVFFAMPFCN
jgi:hypothetical protein